MLCERIIAAIIAVVLSIMAGGCKINEPANSGVAHDPPTYMEGETGLPTISTGVPVTKEPTPSDPQGSGGETVPTAPTEATVPVETNPSDPTEECTEPPATEVEATQPVETQPASTEPPSISSTEPNPPANEHSHTYTHTTVSPSCTAGGYINHCCSCGHSYTDSYTDALGHAYTSVVIEPTTESSGCTIYTCSRCGDRYRDNYTEKLPPPEVKVEDIVAAAMKYINQFRLEEGSTELSYLPGMSQVAQYRSVQLITNFAHDTADKREALAYYQYGEYKTPAGWDPSEYYYEANTKEAIGYGGYTGTADEIGYRFACLFKNSAGHWRYVGSANYSYVGIGCSKAYSEEFGCDMWYCCVMVGTTNYG